MASTVVITMAGMGNRFRQAGYNIPKYQISVRGRTLFSWSIDSLRNWFQEENHFIFVSRREDQAETFILEQASMLGISKATVLEIDELTDGQATTVLQAEKVISDRLQAIMIYNIDTCVDSNALNPKDIRGAGWIPCFRAQGDAWSFVALGSDNAVTEVREKRRISPFATIGLYWFETFALYRELYDRYYSKIENCERGEKYVAPLYNQLISEQKEVRMHLVPESMVYPLGTPMELQAFEDLEKTSCI